MHVALHHPATGIAPGAIGSLAASALTIRALRPKDEALYPAFMAAVSANDRRLRFFSPAPLSTRQIHAFTHFDPATAAAFVAVGPDGALQGVARLHRVPDGQAEFAVLVRSDLKGRGLGRALMETLLAAAPRLAVSRVLGFVLPENTGMLALARDLGFTRRRDPDDAEIVRVSIDLGKTRTAA